ncbi:hypothetical protein [Paenibacillus senegalensis]|nr:hypothetical protein [Paenibacillus senegalensis]
MTDHREPEDKENPLSFGRGLVYGLIIGAGLWVIILAALWLWLR